MKIAGFIASIIGAALWCYGYCVSGHPTFVNWAAVAPWWIADFIPNREAELGLSLSCLALIPIYWPSKPSG